LLAGEIDVEQGEMEGRLGGVSQSLVTPRHRTDDFMSLCGQALFDAEGDDHFVLDDEDAKRVCGVFSRRRGHCGASIASSGAVSA
jgi:hypothetical protein